MRTDNTHTSAVHQSSPTRASATQQSASIRSAQPRSPVVLGQAARAQSRAPGADVPRSTERIGGGAVNFYNKTATSCDRLKAILTHPVASTSIPAKAKMIVARASQTDLYETKKHIYKMEHHREKTDSSLQREVNGFNAYYGEGSASMVRKSDPQVMKMDKIAGETLQSLRNKEENISSAPTIDRLMQEMLVRLQQAGIDDHGDLNDGNILVERDPTTNELVALHPIDFETCKLTGDS